MRFCLHYCSLNGTRLNLRILGEEEFKNFSYTEDEITDFRKECTVSDFQQ